MYAKGMTTRQISDTIQDIYGFETSEGFISDVTDKLLPEIEEWQNRPLEEIYPVIYIDAIHYSVRDNGVIRKLASYVILGLTCDGHKEVLSLSVGENESSKYWLNVLNELKNCGVKDIMVICADGLTGIKEAINAAFHKTEYQRCIVHQVRNTLKYVADKDRKPFAADLKTIYHNLEFIYCFTDNSYKMILQNQLIQTWWQEPLSPWLYGLYVILSLTPLLILKF